MRKSVLSLAVVALVALPALAGKWNKKVSVGDKAPEFSGIPATMKGEDTSLTLKDIKEDVVVLVFLANHCPVVVANEDRFIDLADSYKGKSVKVVGVAVTGGGQRKQDDLPAIKKRVQEKGYNYVYGFDETQEIGRAYGATATPTVFVLDKDRVIRYMGALDDNTMNPAKVSKTWAKDAIDALLDGKEVPVKETQATGCGITYNK
jgi:peroxiredoxin